MTILDGLNEIFKWFQENHCFRINKRNEKDDFNKLLLVSENKNLARLVIIKALENFEKDAFVEKVEDEDNFYWILSKPFEAYPQSVAVEGNIAIAIATIINKWCEGAKDESNKCKASNITPKDIQTLIAITLQLINRED